MYTLLLCVCLGGGGRQREVNSLTTQFNCVIIIQSSSMTEKYDQIFTQKQQTLKGGMPKFWTLPLRLVLSLILNTKSREEPVLTSKMFRTANVFETQTRVQF